MKRILVLGSVFTTLLSIQAEARPTVVELFTAQGCPNCPAADEVMKDLVKDPNVLPLTFHVTIMDNLGWKDTFATPANSQRQILYSRSLKSEIFTPQMVVDGAVSVVGNDPQSVQEALRFTQDTKQDIPITIEPSSSGDGLSVTVGDGYQNIPDAKLYEVHFNRTASTYIGSGGTGGTTVENVNNVVSYLPIKFYGQYFVPFSNFTEDGIAYLLHDKQNHVLGAGYYIKPSAETAADTPPAAAAPPAENP